MRSAPFLTAALFLVATDLVAQNLAPTTPVSDEIPPIDSPVVAVGFQQPLADAAESAEITPESIDAELAKVESAADLEDELKEECVTRLNKAKEWVKSRREWSAKREEAETELAAIPQRVAEVRETLAGPVEAPPPELPANATIAQLETHLDQMRQQQEATEADAAAKQQATETRAKRLADLAKEVLDVEKRITESKQQLAGLSSTDLISTTKKLQQLARLSASADQLAALKAQRRWLEAANELMPLERDLAVRTATASTKQLQRWQDAVSSWRKQESRRQAEEARRVVEQSHPALRSLAEQNAEIAELRITTASGIERVAKELKTVKESSKRLAEQFDDLRGKVEHAGATASTGILLRKQRGDLPESGEFAERAEMVLEEMPKAHLRLMELKQWRRDVADPEEASNRVMRSVEHSLAAYNSGQVHAVVKRLLSDRRDLLDKLIPDQDTYLQDLHELDL